MCFFGLTISTLYSAITFPLGSLGTAFTAFSSSAEALSSSAGGGLRVEIGGKDIGEGKRADGADGGRGRAPEAGDPRETESPVDAANSAANSWCTARFLRAPLRRGCFWTVILFIQ